MHSAVGRLLAGYAAVLAVVMVLFGGALILGLNYSFDTSLKSSLENIAADIRNDELRKTIRYPAIIDAKEEFPLSPVYIEVYENGTSEKKRILWTKNMEGHRLPILEKSGFDEIKIPFISHNDETAILTQNLRIDGKEYMLEIATPIEKIDDTIETFIGWLIALGLLAYIAALFIGYKTIDGILAPMKSIIRTADTISRGSLSQRVPLPKQYDEFYTLARTFNAMLARLEEAFSKIDRFNANVSHELKTPLTIIRGEIEVALMKERSTQKYTETLRSILEETEAMQSIVEAMLTLSRSDSQARGKCMTPIRLDEIIKSAIEEKKEACREQRVKVTMNQTEPVSILGEPTLLKQAVTNLIDNAIKYSPSDATVTVDLHRKGDAVQLRIEDRGCGIRADQIEKIFDPFYRADLSHAKSIPGQGLGLSIVQRIVSLHNGEIDVRSVEGKGTAMTLLFPIGIMQDSVTGTTGQSGNRL